jgi:hypothetical protein
MRNANYSTRTMARKIKNMKNETQTMFDLEYSKKHSKTLKRRNEHCRTWSMAGKLKIMDNEKHTL